MAKFALFQQEFAPVIKRQLRKMKPHHIPTVCGKVWKRVDKNRRSRVLRLVHGCGRGIGNAFHVNACCRGNRRTAAVISVRTKRSNHNPAAAIHAQGCVGTSKANAGQTQRPNSKRRGIIALHKNQRDNNAGNGANCGDCTDRRSLPNRARLLCHRRISKFEKRKQEKRKKTQSPGSTIAQASKANNTLFEGHTGRPHVHALNRRIAAHRIACQTRRPMPPQKRRTKAGSKAVKTWITQRVQNAHQANNLVFRTVKRSIRHGPSACQ